MVELGGEGGALALGEGGEMGALGQVLAEEPVGIFVRAAFPGMVRRGEIDRGVQPTFERLVHVELTAVIRRDGVDRIRFVSQEGDGAPQRLLGADPRDLADADQAAFAFDDGDGRGFSPAVHGVDLPITQARAPLDNGWTLRDHPLAGQAAAAVVAPVALALELVGAAQMTPEAAPVRLVRPDVQVDRLVAHDPDALESAASHDLLRTEILPQQAFDRGEVLRGVAPVAPGTSAPAIGLLAGEHRPIGPIVLGAVAPDLPVDRAAMSLQDSRNLRGSLPLRSHCSDRVSFLRAKL